MSAIGVQSQINKDRALWLSTIPTDVIHGDIICDTISANAGYISSLYTDNLEVSTLKASTLSLTTSDVSGMYVSSLRGNTAFFSSMTLASDLSGGVGYVRFSVDASGIQVDGDPIRFDNLLYITSSINIVQVSTIVDTDIFGSNGYFSTISTGNLSTGLASIDQANISSLYVSSLTALDVSGDFAERWSAYPTLNSSIVFQPSYVLSNVNQKLYFAGQELTDASGGGIDWSYFPAQTDVSMNNFSIRQLSTLQYQDGARLYSQTGNNLFYNGQPVQFGTASNVSQWANYPAVNTIQTGGFPISSLGNLNLVANSNVRILADSISSVADQGLLNPTINSDINLTAQNGLKGRINLTANPGVAGLFGEVNITANGGTTGGVGTGGLITLNANTPLGFSNLTSAVKISGAGVNSYAGVVPPVGSLAGYNFIYGTTGVNICAGLPPAFPNIPFTTYLYGTAGVTTSSDFYCPNIYPYWNGLTTPPDLNITGRYITPNLAQVYVNLSNVKNIYMDGGATMTGLKTLNMSSGIGIINNVSTINGVPFGEVLTQSNIFCSNVTATQSVNTTAVFTNSTITSNSLYCAGQSQISTLLVGFTLGISSVFGTINVNNIKIADDITGVTNAPMPLQSRLLNFSTLNSFNVSTTDLWVSSINGQPIDPSGTPLITISSFNNAQASSFHVSTLKGWTGNTLFGSTINVETGFTFVGQGTAGATSGKFLSSLKNIFTDNLQIETSNTNWTYNPNITSGYIRVGGGSAFDSYFRQNSGRPAFSTNQLMTSSIITTTLDISGGLTLSEPIFVPLGNSVQFDDGSLVNFSQFEYRDVANNAMVALTDGFGLPPVGGSNMMKLGVGELWLTGASDEYQAVRLYSEFPYGNYELDAIDADGATLFAYIQGYYNGAGLNPGFLQAYSNVSSISGYNENSATNPLLNVIGGVVTSNLIVSSINGASYPPPGGSGSDQFSTLFTSSIYVSSLVSVGSNTNFNYPILLDYDQAGNANGGVAIAVQGHNYGTGFVINRLEMGARGNGQNYIMSVWPGQNLEDLAIDATEVVFNDGNFSTIVNSDPYGLITNGSISAPQVLISSINGHDARPAYTNNLMLSTMELYATSTTLMYWDSASPSSNINSSGYDAVVGVNGTYKIGVSYQFISGGSSDEVEFFVLKNNNVIVRSGGIVEVQNNQEIVEYAEIIEQCANGDVIQAGCFTRNPGVYVSTINGNVIQSPAVILTMYKVD